MEQETVTRTNCTKILFDSMDAALYNTVKRNERLQMQKIRRRAEEIWEASD